jgi:uncharacterized RDD family membrane protein YckC
MVDTAEGVRIRTEIAGLGSRLAACLLDLIVVLSGWLLLILLFLVAYSVAQQTGIEVLRDFSMALLGGLVGGMLLIVPLYFTFFQVRWNGQTPGKRALNIRVVSADGGPASTLQHLLRSVFWWIDMIIMVPVSLGAILIAVTSRCTRIGDFAAGTLVLYERTARSHEEPWVGELWSERSKLVLALSPGMGSQLGDDDLVLLRDTIGRRDLPRNERKRLYRGVIKFYSKKLGLGEVEVSTTAMKELYLFIRESRTT